MCSLQHCIVCYGVYHDYCRHLSCIAYCTIFSIYIYNLNHNMVRFCHNEDEFLYFCNWTPRRCFYSLLPLAPIYSTCIDDANFDCSWIFRPTYLDIVRMGAQASCCASRHRLLVLHDRQSQPVVLRIDLFYFHDVDDDSTWHFTIHGQ